jgi:hypothetical protein
MTSRRAIDSFTEIAMLRIGNCSGGWQKELALNERG